MITEVIIVCTVISESRTKTVGFVGVNRYYRVVHSQFSFVFNSNIKYICKNIIFNKYDVIYSEYRPSGFSHFSSNDSYYNMSFFITMMIPTRRNDDATRLISITMIANAPNVPKDDDMWIEFSHGSPSECTDYLYTQVTVHSSSHKSSHTSIGIPIKIFTYVHIDTGT